MFICNDKDFGELFFACQKHRKGDFLVQEGFLLKGTRLCIPKCTTHELLIKEVHGGSLGGHYGENKTRSYRGSITTGQAWKRMLRTS